MSKLTPHPDFSRFAELIHERRTRAFRLINSELIDLYWEIGSRISERIQADGWGRGTVTQLAEYLAVDIPGLRGFSASNLWRMRQFYETWCNTSEELARLLRELAWSSHRDVRKAHENPSIGILLCKTKDDEVVEYAMSRSVSPALVAEYQLQLPDKKLLQAKLHEFFELETDT